MSLLKGLFGRKDEGEPIRLVDEYGRETLIPREAWRTQVLPDALRKARGDAEALAALLIQSLEDGFLEEILDSAGHLQSIDPAPARAACILGILHLKAGRLDEAEKVLSGHIARHGEEGSVLCNLAKVHAERGDAAKSARVLWRSLELDPNQDNALLWYASLQPDRTAGFEKVRALKGSWRAQLWLAREALERNDPAAALALYAEVFSHANPVPADALQQISGDLGNRGLLKEILEVCGPVYDPGIHGLGPGNNLMKAHADLGETAKARAILERLYSLQRPDWKPFLDDWDSRLAKPPAPVDPANLEASLLTLEGPVWARKGSPAQAFLPSKPGDAPPVAFLAASVSGAPDEGVARGPDVRGRLSRGIPMFLAEQVHLRTPARGRFLVPWAKQGIFLVYSTPVEAGYLQASGAPHAVLLHLDTKAGPWSARFRLVRTAGAAVLSEWEQALDPADPDRSVRACVERTLRELKENAGLAVDAGDGGLPASLPQYLLGLDQALAVLCTEVGGELVSERAILDNLLDLCLREPGHASSRFLLLSTMAQEAKRRPQVAAEYRAKVRKLQQEHPLGEPARAAAERMESGIWAGGAP